MSNNSRHQKFAICYSGGFQRTEKSDVGCSKYVADVDLKVTIMTIRNVPEMLIITE